MLCVETIGKIRRPSPRPATGTQYHGRDTEKYWGQFCTPIHIGMLEKAPDVAKIRTDGGCRGPRLAAELEKLGLGSALEIVKKTKDVKELTVLYRSWFVERTFAWMSRCRRLAKDYEGSLESSLA